MTRWATAALSGPAPSVAAVRVVITVTMTVTNQRIFDPRCACFSSTSQKAGLVLADGTR